MSIASEITRINNNIASAYTAVNNKGGTLPATQNSANLATAIGSISAGGTIDSLTITPTTSQQTITASGGVDGYSPITVNAVTSSIDNNITAGNIKSGVSILGVSGSVTPLNGTTLSVTPTTSAQSLTPSSPYNGYTSVSVSAVTSSIDANITEGNIKKDVQILGVTGTYEGGGGGYTELPSYQVSNGAASRRSGALTGNEFSDITSVGNNGLYYAFYNCTGLTGNLNLSSLTSVGNYGLYYAFVNCTGLTGVDLSSLTTVGQQGLQYAFSVCIGLTSVNLSSLTSVGNSGLNSAFYYCLGLTSVNLSSLTTVDDSGLNYAFYGCAGLTDIYFNSLTTTSFGSNTDQFLNMLSSTGTSVTHTLHFPSNLQSTIQGLGGYPTFGGSSGYVVLAFDLPATS